MIVGQYINSDIPVLSSLDIGDTALALMDEYRLNHLPIVENNEFLGLISEDDVYNFDLNDEELGEHVLKFSKSYIQSEKHIYDAMRLFAREKLTLLPVLDYKNQYLGSITLQSLNEAFSTLATLETPGGIIVLDLNIRNYSLSEIARIVEGNDAKILSLYLTTKADTTELQCTLKINRTDLTRIIQTFNRYNYIISATYHESEFQNDLKDRFDSFMNYLNI
jgi:predicted transcriptional regulator